MSIVTKYKNILKRHSVLLGNFTYISILQVFVMISPLITYPYLVRVLGTELYGWVITAQVVVSYCSIIIDFGFKRVSARHISIHRDNKEKLSEIMSAIFTMQIILWMVCLIVYLTILEFVPAYKQYFWLFTFSYGLTLNELLFPQYFFQGVEKMKYITIVNILMRIISIVLIFIYVTDSKDYVYVPILYTIGYLAGGLLSLYVIYGREKLKYKWPSFSSIKYYFKDASLVFYTDVICTIKDKLNYILLGSMVRVSDVVIYDLGSKFMNVVSKPVSIVATVLFPKMAKDRNYLIFKKILVILVVITVFIVTILNLFLPQVVHLFIDGEINLLPIRLYLIAPILVGASSFISSNLILALGYTKYILSSIIFTTIIYLILLSYMYFMGYLTTVTAFVTLAVLSYLGELTYRLWIMTKIGKLEKLNK